MGDETNPKWTPGPWVVDDALDVVVRGTTNIVALCFRTNPQGEANAHLIAAAPDLYEALEMVRDADDDARADGLNGLNALARRRIDCALTKARGEGE